MAQPTPFDRQTSFALFSAENPGEPHSGVDLDAEFNAAKLAIDETQANLALIQRDDGTLAAGSVGVAQLDESAAIGFTPRGTWTTATVYTADTDVVFHTTKLYLCLTDHTSGTFATDLAAVKWREIADLGVQVLDTDTVGTDELQDDAVTTAKILAANVTTAKLAALSVTTAKLDELSVTEAKLAAAVANKLVPAGSVIGYAGATAPTGWLLCYGQAVSRATYPALFTAIGIVHGAGDASTTFNLPDLRGRVFAGKSDMGGSESSRMSATYLGANGATLGAAGGSDSRTMLQANLPAVNFVNSGIALTDSRAFQTAEAVPHAGGALALPGAGSVLAVSIAKVAIEVASGSIAISAQGSAASGGFATPISDVQPTIILNAIIKAH